MPARPSDLLALAEALRPAMQAAGALIQRYRARGVAVREKPAEAERPPSPVTDADVDAEALLAAAIRSADPGAIIVGEEASAAGRQPLPTARFWLIDPLDGTRAFVDGGDDYSVNIGLVVDGAPAMGLVQHPPTGALWAGIPGLGAWKDTADGARRDLHGRAAPARLRILTSHSHLDARTRAWLAETGAHDSAARGSSLKFCLLAEGTADLYPRFGPTHEWDTAAADAVLRAAGGQTLGQWAGGRAQPLVYGKADYLNGPFLALTRPTIVGRLPEFRA